MKRIKRIFGRFYLKDSDKVRKFIIAFCGLCCICILGLIFSAIGFKSVIPALFLGLVIVLSLGLMFCFISAMYWVKELPEYFIQKAEEILKRQFKEKESNFYTLKLRTLFNVAKERKNIDDLKEWLEKIDKYQSLCEEVGNLYKKKDEMTKIVTEKDEERKELGRQMSKENYALLEQT